MIKAGVLVALGVVLSSANVLVRADSIGLEDDRGKSIRIEKPAERVITLAPHLAEMMYEIGAGERLVGTVEWSNHPPAAMDVPRIGDGFRIDAERIISMQPDLILAWGSGTPGNVILQLEQFEIPVVVMSPRSLEDISRHLHWMGRLTGHHEQADREAQAFRDELVDLRSRFADKQTVSVLYQINDPLIFTIGGSHSITQVIETCGGQNIFSDLPEGAHSVSREAVLARDPDVILVGAHDEALYEAADWAKWPRVRAVQNGNVYRVNAESIARAAPRILEGVKEVCSLLVQARS